MIERTGAKKVYESAAIARRETFWEERRLSFFQQLSYLAFQSLMENSTQKEKSLQWNSGIIHALIPVTHLQVAFQAEVAAGDVNRVSDLVETIERDFALSLSKDQEFARIWGSNYEEIELRHELQNFFSTKYSNMANTPRESSEFHNGERYCFGMNYVRVMYEVLAEQILVDASWQAMRDCMCGYSDAELEELLGSLGIEVTAFRVNPMQYRGALMTYFLNKWGVLTQS